MLIILLEKKENSRCEILFTIFPAIHSLEFTAIQNWYASFHLLVLAFVHRQSIAPVIIVISHLSYTYTHASLVSHALIVCPDPSPVLAREICLYFSLFFSHYHVVMSSLICANRTHNACSIDRTRVLRLRCAVRIQRAQDIVVQRIFAIADFYIINFN